MLIGYVRPLHNDLDCKKQYKDLNKNNRQCERIVTEAHASAKRRTQLDNMINQLNQGDSIIVTKLYVLADSTRHLVELLNLLANRGAFLQSIQEGINTSNQDGYSFHYLVNRLLEFQSDVVSETTKRGLSKAKEKGISAGRPRKPDENVKRAIIMYENKNYSLADIKNETGISKSTLYRYLEK